MYKKFLDHSNCSLYTQYKKYRNTLNRALNVPNVIITAKFSSKIIMILAKSMKELIKFVSLKVKNVSYPIKLLMKLIAI